MFGSKIVDDKMEMMERAVRFRPEERQSQAKPVYQAAKPGGLVVSRVPAGSVSSRNSKVFPEDHKPWRKQILDPGSYLVLKWNRIFLISSLVTLFIDPLFFFLPSVTVDTSDGSLASSCIRIDRKLGITVTVFRTFTDLFYVLHMIIKFWTVYIAPSSRVFGRGELVMDLKLIARRYSKTDFLVDIATTLPLPQIVIWLVIPGIRNSGNVHSTNTVALIVLFLYIPRLYLIFPVSYQIIKSTYWFCYEDCLGKSCI